MLSFLSPAPANLGLQNGQLAPCPDSPNCVSSLAEDSRHAIGSIRFSGSEEAAMSELRQVLLAMPRTEIVLDSGEYIHATTTSRLFGFVDDLEFLLSADDRRIYLRSASRVGYSDLGVNRSRIERIREALKHLNEAD